MLLYTNAKVYIGKKEWEGATTSAPSWGHGRIMHEFLNNPQCRQRLVLVEDQQVLPGIESFWVGGHTPGSMAYCVNTAHGRAVLTGDTISLLANYERNAPLGVFSNLKECEAAIEKIRAKDVIITHLHADHYDYFDAFPKARMVVNRREYEENTPRRPGAANRLAPDVREALAARPEALQLVEDKEIVPGVRVFPLGCHTPGSQGVLVRTYMGPVVLTGDVVYKYENIEKGRAIRSPDERARHEAMARSRSLADIILPAHDPLTLQRWPDGIIGVAKHPAN